MPEKVYRTAVYLRLSKDDGDRNESNSIVNQKALCQDYVAKNRDLELVKVFTDDGYSGTDFDRPAFREMEQYMYDGKIDAVLVKDLSRLSRNYVEGGRYLEKIFPEQGIRFISINDAYDSIQERSQSDSLIIPFKNLINDSYCRDISIKIRSSLNMKKRKGEYVGAFTPYGYRKDDQNRNQIVPDEYAGGIVQDIFSWYKAGSSVLQIADQLNERGVLSPMEYKKTNGINFQTSFRKNVQSLWSYRAVHRILTNEIYTGVLIQGKRGTPNYKVHVVREKEENEWIRVEDSHEALITYEDFKAVQEMLGRDTRVAGNANGENVFSGFLFCADCGLSMYRKIVPGKKRKYYYFRCSGSKSRTCTTHEIQASELERVVTNAIQSQVSNVLSISELLKEIENLPQGSIEETSYQKHIRKLEEEIEHSRKMKLKLYEDLTDGILDKTNYMDLREQYTDIIEERMAVLERVKRELRDAKVHGGAERLWISRFKEYGNIQKVDRRVLMALVDKIIIHNNHAVEVVFKYRDEFEHAIEMLNDVSDDLNSIGQEENYGEKKQKA